VRGAVLVALFAALPSLPLAAATEPAPATASAKPQTIQAAVRAAAVRDAAVVAAPRTKTGSRAAQSGSAKQSKSFFRTGPGAVALAVMGLGVGYAIYSASNDRIHSPAKQ